METRDLWIATTRALDQVNRFLCYNRGRGLTGQARAKYNKWKRDVFQRDDNSCRVCGIRPPRNLLQIHRHNPATAKAYDLDNAISICAVCHARLHDNVVEKQIKSRYGES